MLFTEIVDGDVWIIDREHEDTYNEPTRVRIPLEDVPVLIGALQTVEPPAE